MAYLNHHVSIVTVTFFMAMNLLFGTASPKAINPDTITFSIPDITDESGGVFCVPVEVSNFNDVVILQFGILYDPAVLQYQRMNATGIPDISIGSTEADQGKLRLLWVDSQLESMDLVDGSSIVEICFIARVQERQTTRIAVSDVPLMILAQNSDLEDIPYKIVGGDIIVSNKSNCVAEPTCLQSISLAYADDLVITPDLLMDNFGSFLECYGLSESQVKLVDLDEVDPTLRDSIALDCNNLRSRMTISIVIEETNDFFHREICQTTVNIDIPSSIDQCIATTLSCSSPTICHDITINVDDHRTFIPYSELVTVIDESCNTINGIYQSNFRTVGIEEFDETLNGIKSISGVMINCPQYQEVLPVEIRGLLNFTNGSSSLVKICTSFVTMIYGDDFCESLPDEIGIFIANKKPTLLSLNNIALHTETYVSYRFNSSELIDGINKISVTSNNPNMNGLSTFDLVLAFRGMTQNDLTPKQAIAADVDLSGGVSTRDLSIMRKVILGINQPEHIGKKFIVDANDALEEFDPYNFDNDYLNYQFNRDSFDPYTGIMLDVHTYGDLNESAVKYRNKNNVLDEVTQMIINNKYLDKGRPYTVPITISNPNDILSFTANISANDALISRINHDYDDSILEYHMMTSKDINMLFFNPEGQGNVIFELVLTPLKDGYLNEFISIGDLQTPEVVSAALHASSLTLHWSEKAVATDELSIYPSPAVHDINLDLPEMFVGGFIELYSIDGRQVFRQDINAQQTKIDLSEINIRGVIIVKVQNGSENMFKKIYVE